MDHLMQLQGQDWLFVSTKASDQGKRAVLQLPSLGAGSCLPAAHKGSAFRSKQNWWPDSMSLGDTAPLATYCHVLLLIKTALKNQCFPLGIHAFPKVNVVHQA